MLESDLVHGHWSWQKRFCQNFFEIPAVHRYAAEELDIFSADVESIMGKAEIAEDTQE